MKSLLARLLRLAPRRGFGPGLLRVFLGLVLLTVVALAWLLYDPPPLGPVRDHIAARASRALGEPVSLDRLTWDWGNGLVIRAKGVRIGGEGLQADAVDLRLAALPLLKGQVVPRALVVSGLDVRAARDTAGRVRVAGFPLGTGAGDRAALPSPPAGFERLRLEGVRLHWVDHDAPGDTARIPLSRGAATVKRAGGGWSLEAQAGADGGRLALSGHLRPGGGPDGWRLAVETEATAIPLTLARTYAGPDGPEALPGEADFSGRIEAGAQRPLTVTGEVTARDAGVRWPAHLMAPWMGFQARARVGFKAGPEPRLQVADIEVEREAVRVGGAVTAVWPQGGGVHVDAGLDLAPAPVAALRPFYRIRDLPDQLVPWLERAIQGGRMTGAELNLRGPLAAFPFENGHGQFRIDAGFSGADLAFHEDWPSLTAIDATLRATSRRLDVVGHSARIGGAEVEEVTVRVPGLGRPNLTLRVDGEAKGGLSDAVRLLARSPLARPADFRDFTIEGRMALDLALAVPLGDDRPPPSARGTVRVAEGRVQGPGGVPPLQGISGRIRFDEGALTSKGLTGRLKGQPVALDLARPDGDGIRVTGQTTVSASELRPILEERGLSPDLARRLTGEVGLRAHIVPAAHRWRVTADLAEAALILPEPLFNGTAEPGRLEAKGRLGGSSSFRFHFANNGDHWRLRYTPADSPSWALAGGLGRQAPALTPGTIRIRGQTERVQLARLRKQLHKAGGGQTGGRLPAVDAQLAIGELRWRQQAWGRQRIHLTGEGTDGGYRLQADLQGKRIQGTGNWRRQPGGADRLALDLKHLLLPMPAAGPGPEAGDLAPEGGLKINARAERFAIGDREPHEARLKAVLEPDEWRLKEADLSMGKTRLQGRGEWRRAEGARVEVVMTTANFGRWLRDLGVYPGMRSGTGQADGWLTWPGNPLSPAAGKLDGRLDFQIQGGEIERFYFLNQILAGVNVLSWPKQLVTGFKAFRTPGLAYDELAGGVSINAGTARLRSWDLRSPALHMSAGGSLDLGARTYDLEVRLEPLQTIDKIVAVVPVVGYLLTGKDKALTTIQYQVTGPWRDPLVVPVGNTEQNFLDTFVDRLESMEWRDLLPWR